MDLVMKYNDEILDFIDKYTFDILDEPDVNSNTWIWFERCFRNSDGELSDIAYDLPDSISLYSYRNTLIALTVDALEDNLLNYIPMTIKDISENVPFNSDSSMLTRVQKDILRALKNCGTDVSKIQNFSIPEKWEYIPRRMCDTISDNADYIHINHKIEGCAAGVDITIWSKINGTPWVPILEKQLVALEPNAKIVGKPTDGWYQTIDLDLCTSNRKEDGYVFVPKQYAVELGNKICSNTKWKHTYTEDDIEDVNPSIWTEKVLKLHDIRRIIL